MARRLDSSTVMFGGRSSSFLRAEAATQAHGEPADAPTQLAPGLCRRLAEQRPGVDGGPANAGPDEQRPRPVAPVEEGVHDSEEADALRRSPPAVVPSPARRSHPRSSPAAGTGRAVDASAPAPRRRRPSPRPSWAARCRRGPGAGPGRSLADRRRARGPAPRAPGRSTGAADHKHGVPVPAAELVGDHMPPRASCEEIRWAANASPYMKRISGPKLTAAVMPAK